MALVNCTDCNERISDRAAQCPKCGVLKPESRLVPCEECGRLVSRMAAACPGCGRPADTSATVTVTKPSGSENSSDRETKTNAPTHSVVGWFIFLGIILVAFATNPSEEAHHARIRQTVSARDPIAGALGGGRVASMMTTYQSIGVASFTKSGRSIVTVGAFGMVIAVEI